MKKLVRYIFIIIITIIVSWIITENLILSIVTMTIGGVGCYIYDINSKR